MDIREFQSTNEWRIDVNYPINRYTVFDYFKTSPFYEPTCNNEIVRNRQLDRSALVNMVGLEYELDLSDEVATPGEIGFVIRKQYRESPTSTRLLSLYYVVAVKLDVNQEIGRYEPILPGTIIPMPDLNAVILFNINAATYYLERAITELSSAFKPSATSEAPHAGVANSNLPALTQPSYQSTASAAAADEQDVQDALLTFDPTSVLPELPELPEATSTHVKAKLFEDTLAIFRESIEADKK